MNTNAKRGKMLDALAEGIIAEISLASFNEDDSAIIICRQVYGVQTFHVARVWVESVKKLNRNILHEFLKDMFISLEGINDYKDSLDFLCERYSDCDIFECREKRNRMREDYNLLLGIFTALEIEILINYYYTNFYEG